MGKKFRIICNKDDVRLDVFLSEKLSITRTKIKALIEEGHIRIAGKIPKPSSKVKSLMEIEGEILEEEPLTLIPQAIPLNILYEDEYILAIDKPVGMVVHPSFGHKDGTLVNAILAYLINQHSAFSIQYSASIPQSAIRNPQLNMRPFIVHRLDKGTTGVILVAKDTKTQEMLSALFKERGVYKTYRAIVEGIVKKEEGRIEGNIGRHPTDRKRMAVLKQGGRDALTFFKVVARLNGFTYIEAYPKTGRTHQIRVHLAHTGHPIVGDDLYGKKARNMAERPLLHAYKIEFKHPVKGTPISIEAPVPEDIKEFVKNSKTLGSRQ
jgi:23S rRNA pseudouridine1911/1915/1917 synthase